MIEIEDLKAEGRYDEAKMRVGELLKQYVDDYRCYEQLADILIFQWKQLEALETISLALSLHSESGTGNYLAGFAYLGLGRFTEALGYLKKANELSPNNSEVLRHYGWALVMNAQTDQGVVFLQRALAISPQDELIMEDLGMALLAQWHRDQAIEYLRRAGKSPMRIEELELLMRTPEASS